MLSSPLTCAYAFGWTPFRAPFCVEISHRRNRLAAFAQVASLLRGLSRTNVHTLITERASRWVGGPVRAVECPARTTRRERAGQRRGGGRAAGRLPGHHPPGLRPARPAADDH